MIMIGFCLKFDYRKMMIYGHGSLIIVSSEGGMCFHELMRVWTMKEESDFGGMRRKVEKILHKC